MKRFVACCFVVVVLAGSCAAQSTAQSANNAQSVDNAQSILGTWINNGNNGDTWVFNADGTLTRGSDEGKFGVADTKLALITERNPYVVGYNISISSDGNTLILIVDDNDGSSYFRDIYWFTRQ